MTEYLHELKQVEFTDFWLQAKSELFLKHLPHANRRQALDLGAGTGLLTFKLAERGWSVDALEPDEEAVEWIKQKAKGKSGKVKVIHGTLESFKPKHAYSLVVMADVLEHIEKDEEALRKIFGLLEEGGTLLLSVPAHPRLWNAHDEHCRHCRRYRKGELRKKLEKAGFAVRDVRYWNLAMVPLALLNKLVYRKTYPHQSINAMPWLNRLLKEYYVNVENQFKMPFGISLFAVAVK